jgi:hypothetical protein
MAAKAICCVLMRTFVYLASKLPGRGRLMVAAGKRPRSAPGWATKRRGACCPDEHCRFLLSDGGAAEAKNF